MGDSEAGDVVAAAANLPLTERVVHKQWKVREDAYRELAGKFGSAAEDSKIYPDFVSLLPKIVRDANAPAQLLGLEAATRFADCAPPQLVRAVAGAVGKAVSEKGLTGRPSNRARAVAAVVMFVGGDAGEQVIDAVVATGFTHRTPKAVQYALDMVREALVTYGAGALVVKPIATGLTPLLVHSNELVRTAAKALLIELHRWVGDGVRAVAKGVPDVTAKELEVAFANNAGLPRPRAEKLTRAMEERVRDLPQGEAEAGDDPFADGCDGEEELDMTEEIDLLPLLPKMKMDVDEEDLPVKDWFAAILSKKWRVRRDCLAWATEQVGDSRLTPGPYGDVVGRLRKVLLKDANVNVVAQAAKFVTALASGLRNNLHPAAGRALVADLLARLKEKNKIATVPMGAALDELHRRRCVSIAELGDELTAAAGAKVPGARKELFLWLDRCFREGTRAADLKGAPLKMLGGLLTAATDDSSPDVRDAAIAGLASLHVLVGERNMKSHMEKLDNLRTGRILALVKELPPPKRVGGSAAPSTKTVTSTSTSATSSRTRKGAVTRAAAKAASPKAEPKKATVPDVSDDEGEISVSSDDALAGLAARFEGFDVEQWSAKSFKARVQSVEVVLNALRSGESVSSADAALVLAALNVAPGLSDSNFMAIKAKLEVLGVVAEKHASPLPRKTIRTLLEPVVDKLGDIKCAKSAGEVFMTLAEATSARFIFEIVVKGGVATNNGRAKVGIAKFANSLVVEFGVPAVPVKESVPLVGGLLHDPPAALRTAALTLAANLAVRASSVDEVRKGLEGPGKVDAGMLELFDAEVGKYSKSPDHPTKKQRFPRRSSNLTEALGANAGSASVATGASSRDSAVSIAPSCESKTSVQAKTGSTAGSPKGALTTKVQPVPILVLPSEADTVCLFSAAEEFSPGSKIVRALKDPDWKTRQKGLNDIDAVLQKSGGAISGDIGFELMPLLRRRFADSNKNIAAAAYGVAGRLGQAMGPGAASHMKVIIPAVLSTGCVDIKTVVRNAAATCLNLWYEAIGLSCMVPYLAAPLGSINSLFRKEYMEWLVPRVSGVIGVFSPRDEDLVVLLDPCVACLRDKTADVRQLAESLLSSIILSVGYSAVEVKVASLNKSARLQLEPVVARIRNGCSGGTAGVVSGQASSPVRGGAESHARSSTRGCHSRSIAAPSPRTTARSTPRATGGLSTQKRTGTAAPEPSTPRSGLRRARPATARAAPVPVPLLEKESEPERLLTQGRGRLFRSQEVLALKPASGSSLISIVVPFALENQRLLFEHLRECVSPSLFTKMSAPANRFQLHLEAIDQILRAMQTDPEALVDCADVLLRWAAFRVEDSRSPPTMVVKACVLISSICEVLLSSGTKLEDFEASSVIPVLVDKSGSNRTVVREAMLSALLSVGDVMEDSMLMAYLVDGMFRSTSAKAKAEVAAALPLVIDRVCANGGIPPGGTMTAIAQVGYGPDEEAGRAAAGCIERVHAHLGDDVWAMVGEVSDDEAELLESRFPQVGAVASSAALEDPTVREPAPESDVGLYVPVPPAELPASNLRAEDFRLSVAPGPPSNVMSAIGDSMQTPSRKVRMRELEPDQTPVLPSRRCRPGGAGQFSFISSQKGSQSQEIIDQLGSAVRVEQRRGLASLFLDIQEPESPLLYQYAVEVLPLLSRGFRDCVERLEEGAADPGEQHFLHDYLNALMAYVSVPSVLRGVDQDAIVLLLSDVVDAMVPDNMPEVDDWDRIRRGANVVVLKVLETCDRNMLFTALFNLLLVERRMGSDSDDKLLMKSQLLIKSVAKVTKRGFADLSVEALLRDLNLFVTSVSPSPGWTDGAGSDDETLRLVRSVVHAVIAEVGKDTLNHLSLIPQRETSPLVRCIEKALPPSDLPGVSPGVQAESTSAPVPPTVLDEPDKRDPQERLAEIFDQMLSSGGEDAGLCRLRAFMVCYPEIDISAHLSKCSVHFQEFVRDGLAKLTSENAHVELKPKAAEATESDVSLDAQTVPTPEDQRSWTSGGNETVESTGQAYINRLREIQLKYGLSDMRAPAAGNGHLVAGTAATSRIVGKENGTAAPLSAAETHDKATALRERMARIREASAE